MELALKEQRQFRMPRRSVSVRQVAFLLFLACQSSVAATLSAPGQTASPGQSLDVPLSFSASGSTVVGIQFDLQWNQPFSLSVTVGNQLKTSTKVLYSAVIGKGILRCLIAGVNKDPLPEGVLLNLLISVDPTAGAGVGAITFANLVAANPDGSAASVTSAPLSIQIQAGSGPQLPAQAIVSAASLLPGPVSPGEIVSLFAPVGTGGTPALLFNGAAAPILYAGANQINAIVPFGLDATQPASVELQNAGQTLGTVTLSTAAAAPALFTDSSQGFGQGAILNQDYSINSAANPATRGSYVMLYGTGFGLLNGAVADGAIMNATVNFLLQPTATVSGVQAMVEYAGSAPGLVAGAAQVNILIPKNISANSAAPILVTVGSVSSPNGVTVALK
jgi:uncharacterized protein (TIGR03437 family)